MIGISNSLFEIEEGKTTQWPKDEGRHDKQRSTRHCIEY
jgi:hypothetical protein